MLPEFISWPPGGVSYIGTQFKALSTSLPGIRFGVICCLLDKLQEKLVDQSIFFHGFVQNCLYQKNMVLLILFGTLSRGL